MMEKVQILVNRRIQILILIAAMGVPALAQTNDADTPLGDIARALRKSKRAPEDTVIDNDNLSKVVDEAAQQRAKGNVKFVMEGAGRDIQVSSPQVTCSLSFNGDDENSAADAYAPQDLPSGELAKLDGPASLDGDLLQVSVYNGTAWKIREITIGLTILRKAQSSEARYGSARLLPAAAGAAATEDAGEQKRPDLTLLYHLKGAAAPNATALFRQALGVNLTPDQEWHWAIVQARGFPPK